MSGIITLSASVRQNLLSLQSTADLLSTTQNRLADRQEGQLRRSTIRPTSSPPQGLEQPRQRHQQPARWHRQRRAGPAGCQHRHHLAAEAGGHAPSRLPTRRCRPDVGLFDPSRRITAAAITGATADNLLGTGRRPDRTAAALTGTVSDHGPAPSPLPSTGALATRRRLYGRPCGASLRRTSSCQWQRPSTFNICALGTTETSCRHERQRVDLMIDNATGTAPTVTTAQPHRHRAGTPAAARSRLDHRRPAFTHAAHRHRRLDLAVSARGSRQAWSRPPAPRRCHDELRRTLWRKTLTIGATGGSAPRASRSAPAPARSRPSTN